jgi:hypothetical protein
MVLSIRANVRLSVDEGNPAAADCRTSTGVESRVVQRALIICLLLMVVSWTIQPALAMVSMQQMHACCAPKPAAAVPACHQHHHHESGSSGAADLKARHSHSGCPLGCCERRVAGAALPVPRAEQRSISVERERVWVRTLEAHSNLFFELSSERGPPPFLT